MHVGVVIMNVQCWAAGVLVYISLSATGEPLYKSIPL